MLIFKIVPRSLWREASASGFFAGSPVDLDDGFIHFSTVEQVRETAARHFAGQNDLVLVAVEGDDLGPTLKWEPSRGGAMFPHLYAPLALDSVRWERQLPLGPDGHRFPDDLV